MKTVRKAPIRKVLTEKQQRPKSRGERAQEAGTSPTDTLLPPRHLRRKR